MTPLLFLRQLIFWLLIAGIQLILSSTYDVYRMPISILMLVLAILNSGMLLNYFTIGMRRYLRDKKKDANIFLNILNPLLSIPINAIILFLLLMLIFNHMLVIIGSMTQ